MTGRSPQQGFSNYQQPIVEFLSEGEFKQFVLKTWTEGSAIDPALLKAGLEFQPEFEIDTTGEIVGTPIHDFCGFKYRRFGRSANLPLFGFRVLNEDRSTWQLYLNTRFFDSKKGKHAKAYRFEAGSKPTVFFPAVTLQVWREVAIKNNIEVDLPEWVDRLVYEGFGDQASNSKKAIEFAGEDYQSFWDWVYFNPEITVVITEGAKKALALLSQGYAAVSLPGAFAGYSSKDKFGFTRIKPELIPGLAEFFSEGDRRIIIAFDSDESEKTRVSVAKATLKLGGLLEETGCSVRVARWSSFEGKGIDDFITYYGDCAPERLAEVLQGEKLKEIRKNQYSGDMLRLAQALNTNSLKVDRLTTGEYYAELPTLEPGINIVQSSNTGTGKSFAIARDWVKPRLRGEGFTVFFAPSNSVGKDFASLAGIPHLHDHDKNNPEEAREFWQEVQRIGAIALCINSIGALPLWFWERVDLVVFDEANAVFNGLMLGGTLKENQSFVLLEVARLLELVTSRGGSIVTCEVRVFDRTIEALKVLSKSDRVTVLDHQKTGCQPWEIELFTGSPSSFIDMLLSELRGAKKIALAVSSQQRGEQVDRLVRREIPGVKVVRIDKKTNDKGEFAGFFANATQFLGRERDGLPDLLIYSPSVPSGVSIWSPFDQQWGIFDCNSPDSWMQQVGRCRLPIPRKVFLRESVHGYSEAERLCSIARSKKSLSEDLEVFAKSYGVDLVEKFAAAQQSGISGDRLIEIENAVIDFVAAEGTALGAQKAIAGEYFIAEMQRQGHSVTLVEGKLPKVKEIKEALDDIKEEIWREDAAIGAAMADDDESDPEVPTHHKELLRLKRKAIEEFPGVDFNDPKNFYEALTKDRGAMRRGVLCQSDTENYNAAFERQRELVDSILSQKIKLPHALPKGAVKAKLLEVCGVLSLLDGSPYHDQDDRAIAIKEKALRWRNAIYQYLGLVIKETQTPVEIANKLLKKFGLEAEEVGRPGKRGEKRDRHYAIPGLQDPFRNQLLNAARRRLEELEKEKPQKADRETVLETLEMMRLALETEDKWTIAAVWEACRAVSPIDKREAWKQLSRAERIQIAKAVTGFDRLAA